MTLLTIYSLNEIAKAYTDGGESPVPSSPPPKMSLRYRIGSRLAAAKNSKELRKNEKNEKVEKVLFTFSLYLNFILFTFLSYTRYFIVHGW